MPKCRDFKFEIALLPITPSLMATHSERFPQVLLLRPKPRLERALSARFRLLKPWESTMPLERLLAAHAVSIRAVISTSLAAVDAPLIGALPSLGFVFTTSSGFDHIDLAECARRCIAVANAGTIYSRDVADYAVGLLLDVLLHVSASDRYVRRGLWPVAGDFPPGCKVRFLLNIPLPSFHGFIHCFNLDPNL